MASWHRIGIRPLRNRSCPDPQRADHPSAIRPLHPNLRTLGGGITERLDFVLRSLHVLVLREHGCATIRGQLFVEGVSVLRYRRILPALSFCEDGLLILAGHRGLEINPTAMDGTGHTA